MPNTASEQSNYARLEQLRNGAKQSSSKWLILDSNKLDGTFHPCTVAEGVEVGFGGTTVADAQGVLPKDVTVSIPITRQEISAVDVYGNDKLNQWPTKLNITLLLDGTQVKSQDFIQDKIYSSHDFGIPIKTDTIVITVSAVNTPNTTVKILEVITGIRMLITSGGILQATVADSSAITVSMKRKDKQTINWKEQTDIHNIHDVLWAPSRQTYCKVQIKYADTKNSNVATVTTSVPLSYNMEDSYLYNGQVEQKHKYMFLDSNSLDGSYHTMDKTLTDVPAGFTAISDANGYLSPPVVITLEFLRRPLKEFTMYGLAKNNEYPVNFSAEAFLLGKSVRIAEVENNDQVVWKYPVNIEATDKIVYTISRINKAKTALKIMELYSTIIETYFADEIMSVDILEESEYQTSDVPLGNISSNMLNLSVINLLGRYSSANADSPLKDLLTTNREIKVWLGAKVIGDEIEWHRMGTFWSSNWRTSRTNLEAGTVAYDRLYQLKEVFKGQLRSNITLYQLAEEVLQDAGVLPAFYEIDDILKTITLPYAWFGRLTHFQALAKIAKLSLCHVYCNRYDQIIISSKAKYDVPVISIDNTKYEDFRDLASQPSYANDLSCTLYQYAERTGQTLVDDKFAFTLPPNETRELEYIFNAIPYKGNIKLEVVGNNIISSIEESYVWGCKIKLINNSSQSSTVTSVSVIGDVLESTKSSRMLLLKNQESIDDIGVKAYKYDEPLMQSEEHAMYALNFIKEHFSKPVKWMSIISKGDFAVPADYVVEAPSYDNEQEMSWYRVKRNRIRWDGALKIDSDVSFERRV